MEITPIREHIGVEVKNIDLSLPISVKNFDKIYDAWIQNTIILFRGQSITPQQQVEFTKKFGDVVTYTRKEFAENEMSEILILSNIMKDGKLIGSPVSGRVWHSDGHYLKDAPSGSMLYGLEVPPEGGDTLFANMFAAYEALPETIRDKIEGLEVVISRVQSRPYNYPERGPATEEQVRDWPDVPQPIVLTHPESGRKALYVGGNVPWRIVGVDEAESMPLVTFLQEFATMPRFVYRHKWQPGDIIIWDNRSAMHRATYYDGDRYRRLMHRTTWRSNRPCVVNA
jgi:alpha-ketoglutarate-dependent taurine dioxygenase